MWAGAERRRASSASIPSGSIEQKKTLALEKSTCVASPATSSTLSPTEDSGGGGRGDGEGTLSAI